MSDNPQTTVPSTPDAGAGQPGGQPTTPQQGQPPAQPAPATPPAAGQTQEPYRAFASEADLNSFVQDRVKRAERSAIKRLASELGFEDADDLKDALQPLRRGQGGANPPAQPDTPAPVTSGANEGARLALALKVGAELNLPAALIARLQGDSEEAMKADAQTLLGLMGSGANTAPRGPGILPVPAGNQAVTFTRTQLSDPKFVRENADAIRRAAAEGRIVNS